MMTQASLANYVGAKLLMMSPVILAYDVGIKIPDEIYISGFTTSSLVSSAYVIIKGNALSSLAHKMSVII